MEFIAVAVPVPAANPGTVTFTQTAGAPLIVNKAAHALVAGTPVSFGIPQTGQALPTGLIANVDYFVSATGLTANAFQITATNVDGSGGTPACVVCTDAGSGANLTCNTDVVRINCDGVKTVGLEIKNTGANALISCTTFGRTARGGNNPLNGGSDFAVAATTEYTTPTYPVIKASASPAALAAGTNAFVVYNVEGFAELFLRAYATGGTVMGVRAHLKSDRIY